MTKIVYTKNFSLRKKDLLNLCAPHLKSSYIPCIISIITSILQVRKHKLDLSNLLLIKIEVIFGTRSLFYFTCHLLCLAQFQGQVGPLGEQKGAPRWLWLHSKQICLITAYDSRHSCLGVTALSLVVSRDLSKDTGAEARVKHRSWRTSTWSRAYQYLEELLIYYCKSVFKTLNKRKFIWKGMFSYP